MAFIGMNKSTSANSLAALVCGLSKGVHGDNTLRYVVEGWQ